MVARRKFPGSGLHLDRQNLEAFGSDLLRRDDDGGWFPGALFEQYAAQWDLRSRLLRSTVTFLRRSRG